LKTGVVLDLTTEGYVRRRDFIKVVAGSTVVWPLAARAQQSAMPVIGFLNSASPEAWAYLVTAFRQGLKEAGYVENQNVAIDYRWAEGHYDRLPELATDLVRRQVRVIVATGGATSAVAAKAATTTIPIVFTVGDDPVKLHLVASLNRPDSNATGVALLIAELGSKRLGLLRELVPNVSLIAVLLNPDSPLAKRQLNDLQEAARIIKQDIHILHANSEDELNLAFATIVRLQAGAIIVGSDPFFNSRRNQIVALAAQHRIPTIYEEREFAVAGGLISYGTSLADGYRQVGVYVGRILKGDEPANLPVQQLTKFELVINLKTAKALGLDVPLNFQQRADEVIE
jgi:putative tryptophan/tyrosine transport system substrate-binding protein